jgi:hypothetical protein
MESLLSAVTQGMLDSTLLFEASGSNGETLFLSASELPNSKASRSDFHEETLGCPMTSLSKASPELLGTVVFRISLAVDDSIDHCPSVALVNSLLFSESNSYTLSSRLYLSVLIDTKTLKDETIRFCSSPNAFVSDVFESTRGFVISDTLNDSGELEPAMMIATLGFDRSAFNSRSELLCETGLVDSEVWGNTIHVQRTRGFKVSGFVSGSTGFVSFVVTLPFDLTESDVRTIFLSHTLIPTPSGIFSLSLFVRNSRSSAMSLPFGRSLAGALASVSQLSVVTKSMWIFSTDSLVSHDRSSVLANEVGTSASWRPVIWGIVGIMLLLLLLGLIVLILIKRSSETDGASPPFTVDIEQENEFTEYPIPECFMDDVVESCDPWMENPDSLNGASAAFSFTLEEGYAL